MSYKCNAKYLRVDSFVFQHEWTMFPVNRRWTKRKRNDRDNIEIIIGLKFLQGRWGVCRHEGVNAVSSLWRWGWDSPRPSLSLSLGPFVVAIRSLTGGYRSVNIGIGKKYYIKIIKCLKKKQKKNKLTYNTLISSRKSLN
jgi:hypothetical protein